MAEESTAFSASGEDAITRTIDVRPEDVTRTLQEDEFDDFYEIERTAKEIVEKDYKRIALQFPDELLHDSVPIYRKFKSRIGQGRELYILADTSYGSCCVDEVAAQHVNADAMIHYGYACISQPSRLPVIYVFGKKPISVDLCAERLANFLKQNKSSELSDASSDMPPQILTLRHDVVYTHQMNELLIKLRQELQQYNLSIIYREISTNLFPTNVLEATETTEDPASQQPSLIFYVGGESLGLTNLLMTNAFCDVYSFDPATNIARIESSRTNKLLMRRYATVQKARDADVFGILVGTLGVASYLPLIQHLRKLLTKHRKKTYTISVGKLNPSKLANFLEIECFVLVACPENSLIEAKDFLKPIITPYELAIALQTEPTWSGKYILNFEQVLREYSDSTQPDNQEEGEEEEDPDQPVFSLITGTYRHHKRYGGSSQELTDTPNDSAIMLRNQNSSLMTLEDSAAGQFLQGRTYQGLETRIGKDAPGVLEQGRSGIARGYQDDHSNE